jgi:hypothetical protein
MIKEYPMHEVGKYTPLPDQFFGKWIDNGSIHDPIKYLKVGCHPHEKGASWMTREQAIQEARAHQERCARIQSMAMKDWSYSFKTRKRR